MESSSYTGLWVHRGLSPAEHAVNSYLNKLLFSYFSVKLTFLLFISSSSRLCLCFGQTVSLIYAPLKKCTHY